MSQDMQTTNSEKIYAFDTIYTTNHIQMLKILLPCLNPPLQKTLALYIKFLELCYTFSFLRAHPYGIKGCGFDKPPTDWQLISDEILPFLAPEEAGRFKQMKQAFQMIKQFESMQSMMEKLDGILPESMNLQDIFQNFMSQDTSSTNSSTGSAADSSSDSTAGSNEESTSKFSKEKNNSFFSSMASSTFQNLFGENLLTKDQQEIYEKFNERFQNL